MTSGEADQRFHIRCDAGASGAFNATCDRVSVSVAQRIFRKNSEEMWDFVSVLAHRGSDGTLKTRVLLCHRDWDDPLELASIESNPENLKVRFGSEDPVTSNSRGIT